MKDLICYCFDYSVDDIVKDYLANGKSMIMEKINTNNSTPNNTFLSTEGVGILDSIEETVSCRSNENDNSLSAHEKPGYALRS